MHPSRRQVLATGLGAGAAAILGGGTARAASPPGTWQDVPVLDGTPPHLWAVAAPTPWSAFVFGQYSWNQKDVTSVLHWNGASWRHQPAPAMQWNWFSKMAAASPDAAWVTGMGLTAGAPQSLYWNGRSWRSVAFPSSAQGGIPALGAEPGGTAWSSVFQDDAAVVMRFERGAWVPKNVPVPAKSAVNAIAARSAADIWIAGKDRSAGDYGPVYTLRWNGRGWRRYDMPSDLVPSYIEGFDILPLSSTDVWAYVGAGGASQHLWHWDGAAWTRVAQVPRNGFLPSAYYGSLAPDGHGGVWIPQLGDTTGSTPKGRASYLNWDGSAWSTVSGPPRASADSWVEAYDLAPLGRTGRVLAVGTADQGTIPFIERFA